MAEYDDMVQDRDARLLARTSTFAALDNATPDALRNLLQWDGLTGAWTREYGLSQLAPGAVLALVDLDGFKAINDTLGHGAGDDVLGTAVMRLQGYGYDVTRLGGDEFLVSEDNQCDGHESTDGPIGNVTYCDGTCYHHHLVQRIVELIEDPIVTRAGDALISASVGVSIYDHDAEQSLALADQRMYLSKGRRTADRRRNRIPDLIESGICQA